MHITSLDSENEKQFSQIGHPGEVPEIWNLIDTLANVKCVLHEINRKLMSKRKLHTTGSFVQKSIQILWGLVHNFRVQEDRIRYRDLDIVLDKVAGQAEAMRRVVEENFSNHDQIVIEFLTLRGYVLALEKTIVKAMYFNDTGNHSTRIISLSDAAQLMNRSEVTMRRYFKKRKVLAYQIIKFWWVPIEEIEKRGSEQHGNR